MNTLKQLFQKHREIILYIFFGCCTTAVNYITYFLCVNIFSIDYIISNIIAWIVGVLFAYFTNRGMVFQSQVSGTKNFLKEMIAFFGARLFSLIVETVLLYVFVNWLLMNAFIAKLILAVVVVILNYIASKLFVFRKKDK
ncbi:MAG: GtrA family protein [Acutalibacteraceae bacterium]